MYDVHTKPEPSIYSIATQYFTRAGAMFGVVARPSRHTKPQDMGRWGTAELHIATGRGGAAGLRTGNNLCMQLIPVHHGVRVPFALHATATELYIETAYGTIRCCFASRRLLLVRSGNGLGLLLEKNLDSHCILHRRNENSWESIHQACCCMVYTPVKGDLRMKADFDIIALSTPQVRGEALPDADGELLLAIEEFPQFGIVRDSYPTYEEGLADVSADWEAYLAKLPAAPEYGNGRERAAYQTWSMLTSPAQLVKHTQIWKDFGHMANAFETCVCAAAAPDPELAADLLLGQLDNQSPDGQVIAACDDTRGLYQCVTAPVQGWALEVLMHRFDLAGTVPKEKLQALYDGLTAWRNWYDTNRTADGCGMPRYEGCEESGYEGSPVFAEHFAAQLPDLSAMLALLEEKLGDLAGTLGRGAGEREAWYESSRTRIRNMLDSFWNGSRFIGRGSDGGAELSTESLIFYRPLILGRRLPEEVLEAMTEDLSEGNGFLTPAGFLTQRVTSPDYDPLSASAGRIRPAESALITTGLLWAGKTEAASEAAQRYCSALLRPVSAAWPAERGFPSAVTAAAYQLLSRIAQCTRN